MSVKREQLAPTRVKLTIAAEPAHLAHVKQNVLARLGRTMKVVGFRPGHAPANLVERQADQSLLQSEFMEESINELYAAALEEEHLHPVQQPQITLQKFVPYTTFEFVAELEVVGDISLPDYKKVRLAKKAVSVTEKDIDKVLRSLQERAADKTEVERAAQLGDEVVLDFQGQDATTKEHIKGADGKEYPLRLGSDTFIPGFEPEVVGLHAGQSKTFTLTFPKDYGVAALQSRKVEFSVIVKKVLKLVEPRITDAFAAKVGPFKTITELRNDIRKQLMVEKQAQADQDYANALIEKIASSATVAIPGALVDEEVKELERQIRQNLAYRGQTWQEYVVEQQKTEEEYMSSLRSEAEQRVKIGLVLAEIANQEHINVSSQEIDLRLQQLKQQYKDEAMQKEIDKPENRRSIGSRLLTEKTIARLTQYASAAA